MASDPTQPTISLDDAAEALLQAMSVWDGDAHIHCRRTAEYADAIATEMGISGDEAALIYAGALLHDIGQMGVELSVLRKPGALDPHETEHVRMHPETGASILGRMFPESIVECARAHHEQPDGNGYPAGLRDEQIPLSAAICRVADVLDSLTTDQTYRPAMSIDDAIAELRDGAGSRYSGPVVRALLALLERGALRPAA
jgi:putative nucleotidyltransferase with HDIG domain